MKVSQPDSAVKGLPVSLRSPDGKISTNTEPSRAERITVAFVIHSMRPGGAERSIARLINALDQQRFAPLLICLTQSGSAADWITAPNIPVIELHKRDAALDRKAIQRLRGTLVAHRIDILHSYNWGALLETTLARHRSGVAAHVHAERGSVLGRAEMKGMRMWLRGQIAGWAMRRCDVVVTNAHSVAQRIEDRCGYPVGRVQVIPNGVETPFPKLTPDAIALKRKRLGISADSIVIGSIGRLVSVKGFDTAVKALASLVCSGREFHLLLVGDGPERSAIGEFATSLGIESRVHLVGHQNDATQWLSLIDIYVNTSRSEGMSQALVEALAAGLPIVATDVGDSAEVIGQDSQCGHLIPVGDIEALSRSVLDLVTPARRSELGRNGVRRHNQYFSCEVMTHRYETLYRRLSEARTQLNSRRIRIAT